MSNLKAVEPETVEKNGCWICVNHCKRDGYPQKSINGKMVNLSRTVYEASTKSKIPDGMCVCHKCDERACINPSHMFLGTRKENNQDRDKKGRQVSMRGEKHGNHKFSNSQILSIRKDCRRQIDIAKEYGVSQPVISQIKRGVTWKTVKGGTNE